MWVAAGRYTIAQYAVHVRDALVCQDLTVVESALLQATGASCVEAEEVTPSAHLRYHTASLCSGRYRGGSLAAISLNPASPWLSLVDGGNSCSNLARKSWSPPAASFGSSCKTAATRHDLRAGLAGSKGLLATPARRCARPDSFILSTAPLTCHTSQSYTFYCGKRRRK